MFDVVALGELLMDLTYQGKSEHDKDLFEANPGGAPANVVSCLSKLGRKTAFVGKVGNDYFGHRLRRVLEAMGVSTEGLVMDDKAPTSLAFVHLTRDGERSFSFYRTNGADTRLHPEELKPSLFNTRLFHFGSLSLTDEPARSATLHSLAEVRRRGALVSYDPNLRPLLWRDLREAKEQILGVMGQADIVKVSAEELEFLSGTSDVTLGSKGLFDKYRPKMLVVTLGDQGCYYRVASSEGQVSGFTVDAIDTTGAGDAFLGGLLFRLLESETPFDQWSRHQIVDAMCFANAVGALSTTKKGAIPALPTLESIMRLLGKRT